MSTGTQLLGVAKTSSVGGKSYSENTVVNGNLLIEGSYSIGVSQPAVLTAGGAAATTATITMNNASHGITTGARIDIYWSGGYLQGALVGTVSGTSVPVTTAATNGTFGPSGVTQYPANATALVVALPQQVPMSFTGNNLQGLVLANQGTPGDGNSSLFGIYDASSPAVLEFGTQINTGGVHNWYTGCGDVNPVAGTTPKQAFISHNNVANVVTLSVAVLSN